MPPLCCTIGSCKQPLEAADGWTGFRNYVERVCAMQAGDRGLKDVLTRTFPNAAALEATRARGFELLTRLIERAQAEGSLRSDFVAEDHLLLMMGNAGVVQAVGDEAPEAWRRYVALMLDGFRSKNATPLPPPPTRRQMLRAMLRLSGPARQKGTKGPL